MRQMKDANSIAVANRRSYRQKPIKPHSARRLLTTRISQFRLRKERSMMKGFGIRNLRYRFEHDVVAIVSPARANRQSITTRTCHIFRKELGHLAKHPLEGKPLSPYRSQSCSFPLCCRTAEVTTKKSLFCARFRVPCRLALEKRRPSPSGQMSMDDFGR